MKEKIILVISAEETQQVGYYRYQTQKQLNDITEDIESHSQWVELSPTIENINVLNNLQRELEKQLPITEKELPSLPSATELRNYLDALNNDTLKQIIRFLYENNDKDVITRQIIDYSILYGMRKEQGYSEAKKRGLE